MITIPCGTNGKLTGANPGGSTFKYGLSTTGGSSGYVEASFTHNELISYVGSTTNFITKLAISLKIKMSEDREILSYL
jgi:hypothetical protein